MTRFPHDTLRTSMLITMLIGLQAAPAMAEDYDVAPFILGSGPLAKLATNAFQDDSGERIENVQIFGFTFGETPGQPYYLQSPGFHPQPGTGGLASPDQIGFLLTEPLRFWSGAGAPSFASATAGESINFEYGGLQATSSRSALPIPAGYLFGAVDEQGEFDDHLNTTLRALGGTNENPGIPTAGVYLVTLQLTTDRAGIAPSDDVYLLFNNGLTDDDLKRAASYVHDSFAPDSTQVVPEPSTLTAITALAWTCLRRLRSFLR